MSGIACIILAAGLSSRMGQSKLLLDWGDKSVIQQVSEQATNANYQDVVVVIGHEKSSVENAVRNLLISVVVNADYETGEMLSSLKVGIRYIQNNLDVSAVAVMLGDLPLMTTDLHNTMIDAHISGKITIPTYEGKRGHPIIFDTQFWDDILRLDATSAPREVIQKNHSQAAIINITSDAIYRDIDTPDAYQACLELAGLA